MAVAQYWGGKPLGVDRGSCLHLAGLVAVSWPLSRKVLRHAYPGSHHAAVVKCTGIRGTTLVPWFGLSMGQCTRRFT